MQEERIMILQMLKDGNITVEEAAKLLEAVPAGAEKPVIPAPKQVRIHIMEKENTKVNVTVPFSLVRAGLKLGQSIGGFSVKFARDELSSEILETLNGVDISVVLARVGAGEITLPYVLVDAADDEGQHVHIALE
ncbi:MAG: hypothetical protein LBL37_01890 [Gracilibacteraceae bacterium]|jgi:hypothetical protein|nr:hypothetical protein [Gracilibacteraceae bacterium]